MKRSSRRNSSTYLISVLLSLDDRSLVSGRTLDELTNGAKEAAKVLKEDGDDTSGAIGQSINEIENSSHVTTPLLWGVDEIRIDPVIHAGLEPAF